jgi:hypothetical protein
MSLKLRRNCNSISIVTTTVLLVLFTTSKYLVNGQHDFQFENENNDDLQVNKMHACMPLYTCGRVQGDGRCISSDFFVYKFM